MTLAKSLYDQFCRCGSPSTKLTLIALYVNIVTKLKLLTMRWHIIILQSARRVRHGSTDVQMVVVSLRHGTVTERATARTAATSVVSMCFIIIIIIIIIIIVIILLQ